jgi:hypothetical protein
VSRFREEHRGIGAVIAPHATGRAMPDDNADHVARTWTGSQPDIGDNRKAWM